MTPDELDEVRRLVLAFEDAAGWCEELAELARSAAGRGNVNDAIDLQHRIARLLQHLAADRESVGRVRTRLGIPPPTGGAPARSSGV